MILSKSYYDQEFVIIADNFSKMVVDKNIIVAEAGADMYELSILAMENSLSGLEYFYDIPGSLGGAMVMNAGSNGVEIKDTLISAKYLDTISGGIEEISADRLCFDYRSSFFQNNSHLLVLEGKMLLQPHEREEIKSRMDFIQKTRWSKQPIDYPNAGSVFKRPEGMFVGPMIEELGLKGFCIGGAQVSEKHAGFIINKGGATGEDILSLISHIQDKVEEKFNVRLEVEQRVI